MDLGDWRPPPASLASPPVEIREHSTAALAAAMAADGDLVPRRLARGSRCFAVWAGDTIAAYGWLTSGPEWIGEVGVEITPGPAEAYIWNCVTLAAHRRLGMFRSLLLGVTLRGQLEGLGRLWIASVAGTAEKAVAEAGFVAVLHLETRRLGSIRWLRTTAATADPALLAAARKALALRRGWRLSSAQVRRH